ncbi:hypothetical protein G7046_g2974 [Stylonectria norvegica]|nr:hypothetical protein G7046_g2974 [Stylonectria norvegica]
MEARMKSRIPVLEKILAATGQPGVSIGVIHHGQVVFNQSLGYRDCESKVKADGDTLYCIASLTKAFITASLGVLVSEGKLRWTDKAFGLVPSLHMRNDHGLTNRLTLVDLVSHRSGIVSLDQLVQGLDGQVLVPKKEVVSLMNELPSRCDLRSEFWYTNVPYSIAGEIIETTGGDGRWDEFLRKKLLSPLGMNRTTADIKVVEADSNLAQPYTCLPDGGLQLLGQPEVSASTLHGCAGGIRSSVNDMLIWSQALLSATQEESDGLLGHSEISHVFQSATIIEPKSTAGGEYCLGWVRQRTPATLGMISPNRRFCSPVIGKDSPSKLMYSHNGDVKGYMASLCLFPEEDAAIVALTNGTGMSDCTDWITQDLAQEMFGLKPANDYVAIATEAAEQYRCRYDTNFVQPLKKNRVTGTQEPSLKQFIGKYSRDRLDPAIEISVEKDSDEGLLVVINGHVDQAYHLTHYHFDTWCLLPGSNEEAIKRGYFGIFGHWEEYLVNFGRRADGTIGWLSWKLDGVVVQFDRS